MRISKLQVGLGIGLILGLVVGFYFAQQESPLSVASANAATTTKTATTVESETFSRTVQDEPMISAIRLQQ